MVHSPTEAVSFSTSEEVSEAASSILKFETSPQRDEISSSPLIDGAGDASVIVELEDASAGDGEDSPSSIAFCRLQYIMLAVSVRSIFWFTCHKYEIHDHYCQLKM
jgi:hypothetical protein